MQTHKLTHHRTVGAPVGPHKQLISARSIQAARTQNKKRTSKTSQQTMKERIRTCEKKVKKKNTSVRFIFVHTLHFIFPFRTGSPNTIPKQQQNNAILNNHNHKKKSKEITEPRSLLSIREKIIRVSAEALILVEFIDLTHVLFRKLKVPNIKVFLNAPLICGLGNCHDTVLNVPADDNLSRGFIVLLGNLPQHVILQKTRPVPAAKRRPGCDGNVVLLAELPQSTLLEQRVQLHLVHHRPNFAALKKLREVVWLKVGNANGPHLLLLVELLQCLPCVNKLLLPRPVN
ncbi:hypothetical protein ECC02_001201 [Trypanosoma cruzi]|uniref:Uncharacterized protein n=1 Tax=Trypanosoma cruzi TaxID=5693 RepID=A0A7J6YGZ3_TRYCR|nr:hypothetical protein ECC02_001201 [Trypanosoma cruzi]